MGKTKNDVLGVKINCPNYIECPLCYGCRNYNSAIIECEQCAKNKKFNICNTNKHQNELIAKFITKTKIKIKETR